jgi:hypothetical protein
VRELSVPRKAHDLMQKGLILLYEKSDYQGSIAQFQRAIKQYIHIHLHKYSAVLQDLNAYLKLQPNGTTADQARILRDRIQKLLEKAQTEASPASDSDDQSTDEPDPDSP